MRIKIGLNSDLFYLITYKKDIETNGIMRERQHKNERYVVKEKTFYEI